MPEKLPLPKEWYKNWDLDKASSAPSTGTNIDADEQEESECPAAIPQKLPMLIVELGEKLHHSSRVAP